MRKQLVLPPPAYLRNKNSAGILIIVLWSLCLLSTFSIILGYSIRQKLTLVNRLDERGKLRLIAEAGVKRSIIELIKIEPTEPDSLNSEWSNNPVAFKNIHVGHGHFNIEYNFFNEESKEFEKRCGLIDEESKININKADETTLRLLLKSALSMNDVDAQELAASIVDWRDTDSMLSIPLGSAEDSDYRRQKYPYEAKDADFQVLDELLLVNGVSAEVFDRIKDYVTIYGDGKVNINTTNREVMLALGLRANIMENILVYRRGEDGIMGTTDDRIFTSNSDIVPTLSAFVDMSPSDVAQLTAVANDKFIATSNYFTAKSIAKLEFSDDTYETICVFNRNGTILYWHEG